MAVPNFPNTQMVTKANDLLKRWWVNIKKDHEDFELTPTLEEIGGFVNLPFQGRQMIVPHKQ
ncbi:hypothetical protein KY289_020579 [Solanum tuberosum]|nr:hypothetical protein KY284_020381 [Solanum tuberosum]KAH0682827.1 hypothetical protein KY289_020579 [Solanum tuberosum]